MNSLPSIPRPGRSLRPAFTAPLLLATLLGWAGGQGAVLAAGFSPHVTAASSRPLPQDQAVTGADASGASAGAPTEGTIPTSGDTPVDGTILNGGGDTSTTPVEGTIPTGNDTGSPGAAVFTLATTRAELPFGAMAYNITRPGLTSVTAGSPITLTDYVVLSDAPSGSQATYEFTVEQGVGVHFYSRSTPQSLPYVPNTYRFAVDYTPREIGKFVVLTRVTVNGVTQQRVFTLSVVKPMPQHNLTGTVKKIIDPKLFAPVRSLLLPSSKVRKAEVATNTVADHTTVPHLSRLSFARQGRVSGYYVDTLQLNNGHPVYLQYLTSTFKTGAAATQAFVRQRDAYLRLASLSPNMYAQLSPGSRLGNRSAMYQTITPMGKRSFVTQDLFFVRNNVVIQVVQSYYATDSAYGLRALPRLFKLAQHLDTVARGA